MMTTQTSKKIESPKYRFDIATNRLQETSFLANWNQLLAEGESQDTIYQTPEFFNFLLETSDDQSRLKIFSITRIEDDQLVGIMPVRIRDETISFQAGSKKWGQKNFQVVGLLGSMPLAPADPDLTEKIFIYLLNQFDDCQAICMAALPSESALWNSIKNSTLMSENFFTYAVDGWRQCHTIPLFSSFELYLKQFSAKKRYNLNRQIRLLREQCGALNLHRIREPSEVPRLMSAINVLVPKEAKSIFLSGEKCQALASHHLLFCYILDCDQVPVALIFGTHSSNVFHVHNISYSSTLPDFSIGTSILHLAIEDLTTSFNFSSIDLGYGIPGHDYQSSNIKKERGYVLIFKKTIRNCMLFRLHQWYGKIIGMIGNRVRNYKKLNR
jgi:hypothetical protein